MPQDNARKGWTFGGTHETQDGSKRAFDVVMTAREIADALIEHRVYVIPEEQRGDDPVTLKELLNEKKVENWVQMELGGRLHMGQITLALHMENGASFHWYPKDGTLEVVGPMTVVDGRQRSYTVRRAVQAKDERGAWYDDDRKVSVRVYVDLDSSERRELFNQMNGGRGGDHASQTRVHWLAPSGPAWIAKQLVSRNPNLGERNVNVVVDKITRKDPRLAGFNSFVEAIGQAFGDEATLSDQEQQQVADFLNDFWTKLVEVIPDLGVLELAKRNQVRERSLVGNPLAIYGFMRISKRLWDVDRQDPPLERLEALGKDLEWFDRDGQMWRDLGVMVPVIDRATMAVKKEKVRLADGTEKEVEVYRPRNAYQTRRAFADAMVRKMFPEDEGDDRRR